MESWEAESLGAEYAGLFHRARTLADETYLGPFLDHEKIADYAEEYNGMLNPRMKEIRGVRVRLTPEAQESFRKGRDERWARLRGGVG